MIAESIAVVPNAGEEEKKEVAAAVGCPSETVRVQQKPVDSSSGVYLIVLQALAGRADVCRGCPGRQLCLNQGQSILQ